MTEAAQEFGIPREAVVEKLREKLRLSSKDADGLVRKYWCKER